MQLLNQTVLVIFSLILLGVLSSTGFRGAALSGANLGNHRYWLASIICRVAAFVGWAITIDSDLLKIAASGSYTASIILLALFIRSWRQPDSRRLLVSLGIVWVGSLVVLWYLLNHTGTHTHRYLLIASWIILGSLWEYVETQRASRTDRSYLLRILKGIIGLQLLIAITGFVKVVMDGTQPTGANFVQRADINASTIIIWVAFGVHLLSYVIINSYLYEKLRISERQSLEQLRDKQAELIASTRENEKIRQLLHEREHLIDNLIKANKAASTGAMAASIAHEMAQPLAIIGLNAELLDKFDHQRPIPPELFSGMLADIRASNDHAASIVQTLRGIFLDTPPVFERTHLRELVDKVVKLARANLSKHGIHVDIDIAVDLAPELYANEIFQVMVNLLNNALNALDSLPHGTGHIDIGAAVQGNDLTLCVADNGAGVAPDLQPKLFQLFAHGDKQGAMGLGLWLCATIAQRHCGSIYYEENPGGGARFVLQLPLTQTI